MLLAGAAPAHAQPTPAERVTFQEAVTRAIQNNPSAAVAAAGILRAEGLLKDARALARPQITGSLVTTTLNEGREFEGTVVTPRNQAAVTLDFVMPLYAPALWARRTQALDARHVATLSAAETRRQIALAAADAYLSVIARRRVVEANVRARDVARAHFELAQQQREAGTGSLLNELRAQEEVSSTEVLLEGARMAVYRAQEALGVLLVAGGAVDAGEEPAFDIPGGEARPSEGQLLQLRPDLRLFSAREDAARRIVNDSRWDYFPTLQGVFQPQATYPAQFFLPSYSWRFMLQLNVSIFDSGQRAAVKQTREAALAEAAAQLTEARTQAQSELRVAEEAVRNAERGLASARAAAEQAGRVVSIVNVSFRAGAATNIEVIDAERRARDAETTVAVAEDALRRARLELLTALGRFPQ
jgi:outer membrane protein TolC